MFFDTVTVAPPDPILGLNEAFSAEANPKKINLAVGVYMDATGKTPILNSVRAAEQALLSTAVSKMYRPIDGDPRFGQVVNRLVFGPELAVTQRIQTAHAPGGTGACRIAGEVLARSLQVKTVWISDPTWPNHKGIFQAAGLEVRSYAYFDSTRNQLDWAGLQAAVAKMSPGDAMVLHGCCHNPTGVDLDQDQWAALARQLAERRVIPVVDFAYQGFGEGLDADAVGLRILASELPECMVATSFSKNFGLYNERVGALSLVAQTGEVAARLMGHAKMHIRTMYSNPPAHGADIVVEILSHEDRRHAWEHEVDMMRHRIQSMRKLLAKRLRETGCPLDASFLERQRGMFSMSGLTGAQVARLRDEYAIYVVGSGRISVAGLDEAKIERLCEALSQV